MCVYMYTHTYILLICFLNTGKTISEDQMGSLTWLVYNYLKFIFVSSFAFVFDGMASAWNGLLRITALSFLSLHPNLIQNIRKTFEIYSSVYICSTGICIT